MYRRILSGMRTTGRLHLGHYVGALKNWIALENDYECFFLLADTQALSTHFDRVGVLEDSVRQVIIDWMSVGLDPEKSSFVLQSWLRELFELTAYFTFLVEMGALEKNPTLKAEIAAGGISSVNLGFMMYPVSQAADILLFGRKTQAYGDHLLVPVGEDQRPHIEFCRDVARRFNSQYGEVFVLPEAKIGEVPRLGDLSGGTKMGKSLGNAINLSDPPQVVFEKVRSGVTDPDKKRKGDPGNPDICPVFSYHKIFRAAGVDETASGCRSGALGCVECKRRLAESLNAELDPIRDRRCAIEQQPSTIREVVIHGTDRARAIAGETMDAVREVMSLKYHSLERE